MTKASNQMARNFASPIAKAWSICSELGVKNRKHAMLWIFQAFALSAGLYGCQIWATNTLTFKPSIKAKAYINHVCFKDAIGLKRSTKLYCLLRETG